MEILSTVIFYYSIAPKKLSSKRGQVSTAISKNLAINFVISSVLAKFYLKND